MATASESDTTMLLQRQAQHSPHENGTYYPPTPQGQPIPRPLGRGLFGRLFQYKDPGPSPYHAVGADEELAPLHRLNDPDRDDEDDEESGSNSMEFEIVNREGLGDVKR